MENLFLTLANGDEAGNGRKKPLYQRIYAALLEEIRTGRLQKGARLPSKRALSERLGVSLNTVEGAYGLLAAEGYIQPRPRSGYYVCALASLPAAPRPAAEPVEPRKAAEALPRWQFDFSTGAVDTELFPYASWARLTREVLYTHPELLARGEAAGDYSLRVALARFLGETRGVVCGAEQIVVGAGVELLLDLLCKLLPRDTVYGLEDPGYAAPYRVIAANDRRIEPLPLDAQGLAPDALARAQAGVIYVTPAHQFPLGMTMPATRRSELLRWAAQRPGRYVIEDDYDSDFRFASRPIPAMQGMDGGRVIYIGTFSRTIAPSIRVAYLVLPPALAARYRLAPPYAASTVSRFEQQTLRRFLEEGLYQRHLRRAAKIYGERRRALVDGLRPLQGARVLGDGAGLHFLLTLSGASEDTARKKAAEAGLLVHGLSEFCHAPASRAAAAEAATLVLGYAGIREPAAAAAALCRALETPPCP